MPLSPCSRRRSTLHARGSLYPIDPADVMSKWVGETERNLGQFV
jgi:hypothetical protein